MPAAYDAAMPTSESGAEVHAAAPKTRRAGGSLAWLLLALVRRLHRLAATHPWWLGPAVSRYYSDGRAAGPLRFASGSASAPLSRRAFGLRGVRIANAPWAETTRPFAVFDDVDFEFTGRRSEGAG